MTFDTLSLPLDNSESGTLIKTIFVRLPFSVPNACEIHISWCRSGVEFVPFR